ncbi:MAG: zinc ribbon domain-containing protein, partial [Myxococcales bacterium]|nr:zinc ribbon domain-containing protein [Myxococcales bacterium]
EMRARFAAEALELDKALQAQAGDYRKAIDAAVDARIAKGGAEDAEPAPAPPAATAKAQPADEADEVAADGPTCAACGAAHDPDALFCDACGAGLGARCPGCEAPNRTGARFCKQCGHDLTAAAEQESA